MHAFLDRSEGRLNLPRPTVGWGWNTQRKYKPTLITKHKVTDTIQKTPCLVDLTDDVDFVLEQNRDKPSVVALPTAKIRTADTKEDTPKTVASQKIRNAAEQIIPEKRSRTVLDFSDQALGKLPKTMIPEDVPEISLTETQERRWRQITFVMLEPYQKQKSTYTQSIQLYILRKTSIKRKDCARKFC